jgi:signal transduction histidine kinase
MNTRLENHNIVSIIEGITLSVADYVKGKDIELIFDTDVEEKIMACDTDKIERIILNLLSNAIKFTKPGDKIMVSVFDRNEKILISVKDSGIGIPKEKLDIIFERFEQVESSLSRNKYGSGIGLSLVKSFVEMQEGKIDIKSEVGIGTEFLIELPVKLTEKNYDYKDDINSEGRVERINIEFSDIYS